VARRHPLDLDLGLGGEADGEADGIELGSCVQVVNLLSLGFFRSKLVEHFDILWRKKITKWPSRRGPHKPN